MSRPSSWAADWAIGSARRSSIGSAPRCRRTCSCQTRPEMGRTYREQAKYEEQAATYDATRSASPIVTRLLMGFLGEGNGRILLDVAGGTGNYAEAVATRGFRPILVDREPAMLAR